MKLGVCLPQTELGGEPEVLRDFAQTAENIGYDHLVIYDHVVGINPETRPDWRGPYTSNHCFHDPFALFGYLAGKTEKITLAVQVLILPQRQTALVARQAASVDLLSGGRLRMGVGIGWNPIEYAVLGEDFKTRGKRSEEQIDVLKALWSQDHVKFEGKWHNIPDVGLNPRPVQRPIPVWLGGHHDNTLKRIARNGDGWIVMAFPPDDTAARAFEKLQKYIADEGRTSPDVGIDAWVSMGNGDPKSWRAEIDAWRQLGVTHLTLNTAFSSYHHVPIAGASPDHHLAAMQQFYEAVGDLL